MLCYRGVYYIPATHFYQTEAGEMIGKYRGADVRLRHLKTFVYQPFETLTYRGVSYTKGVRKPANSMSVKTVG